MELNPCVTRCILKKLGRKKIWTKVVILWKIHNLVMLAFNQILKRLYVKEKRYLHKSSFQVKGWPSMTLLKNLHLHNVSIHLNLYQNECNITSRKHSKFDSNPCTTRCIMKKLGRKKTRTKGVHKNVRQGYNKVKLHIMKNLHLCYVNLW